MATLSFVYVTIPLSIQNIPGVSRRFSGKQSSSRDNPALTVSYSAERRQCHLQGKGEQAAYLYGSISSRTHSGKVGTYTYRRIFAAAVEARER